MEGILLYSCPKLEGEPLVADVERTTIERPASVVDHRQLAVDRSMVASEPLYARHRSSSEVVTVRIPIMVVVAVV